MLARVCSHFIRLLKLVLEMFVSNSFLTLSAVLLKRMRFEGSEWAASYFSCLSDVEDGLNKYVAYVYIYINGCTRETPKKIVLNNSI